MEPINKQWNVLTIKIEVQLSEFPSKKAKANNSTFE